MTAYTPTRFRLLLFIDCYWLFFFFLRVIKNKLKISLIKFAYSKYSCIFVLR